MNYYPLFMNLQDRAVLVVGGGSVAARKISLLLRAGARISVVAPSLNEELQSLANAGSIQHRRGFFRPRQLDRVYLVIAATDDAAINRQVATAAEQRQLLVNVVDQPDLCSFISPAIVDRNPLLIAISSAGAAPVLVRQLRQRLEQWLPANLGELAAWAGRWRQRVKQQLPFNRRRPYWERIFFGPVAAHWLAGRRQQAQQQALTELNQAEQCAPHGEVYLVGAGPGDPDLLTLRALQLMQQADVILYDKLVSAEVLERARRDAERIFVGKSSGCHHATQDQIHQLMRQLAASGKRVCRLKGGDPLIFGRGGEEMAYLRAHDIPYQVVPGITAAAGCAAYAGIPLTHRDLAHGVRILTGHGLQQRTPEQWRRLVDDGETLVFYMALERLDQVVQGLRRGGAVADLPAAVVEHGTRPEQRVISGNLQTIKQQVTQAGVSSPALLIVGKSAALAEQLAWYQGAQPSLDIDAALQVA
ncbi:MAG: siroheme synthase CysG [Wenzhouxiangellaceae bacterium]